MNFSERLNYYIAEVGCSAKQLADASTLSAAAISRYRSGERAPDPDGSNLRLLSEGIALLSSGRLTADGVQEDLAVCISGIAVDYDTFLGNLKALASALSIGNNELARALSFDPSYISRIMAGQRRPADMQAFVQGVAGYVAGRQQTSESARVLSELVCDDWQNMETDEQRARAVAAWLRTNFEPVTDPLSGFLLKLDAFDLNDFIRSIHFDEMTAPTVPLQLPTTRTVTGLRNMMQAEIDYLRATVLSRSSADVIMFSDMPMRDMAADPEFPKQWMFGMAMLLKKGLHLHIVHDTARPLHEMLLGLESYIPMYMTGQISPYYFPVPQSSAFCTLLKVSGTVALAGEAVAGHQAEGRYTLTKSRDEVRYYRKRAERMLEQARPLMRIITAERRGELAAFEAREAEMAHEGGTWRVIAGTLPLVAIPPEVLERVLERAGVSAAIGEAVSKRADERTRLVARMAGQGSVTIEVPDLTEEEFAEHPLPLSLADLFSDVQVRYTYDDYRAHLQSLQQFCARFERCTLVPDRRAPFRNIQIRVCSGSHAVISKSNDPAIHFIIEHPSLVKALEAFVPPMREG